MSLVDEAMADAIFGPEGSEQIDPAVTSDGADYVTFLMQFTDLVDMGVVPTSRHYFLAPPLSVSCSYH